IRTLASAVSQLAGDFTAAIRSVSPDIRHAWRQPMTGIQPAEASPDAARGGSLDRLALLGLTLLGMRLLPFVLLLQQLVGIEVLLVETLHLFDDGGGGVAAVNLVQALLPVGIAQEHIGVVGRFQEALGVQRTG